MTGSDGDAGIQAAPLEGTFADALDALQDGFLVLDRGWRIVFANRTAARRLDTEPRALVGTVLWERIPRVLGTRVETAYRQVMAEREPLSIEVEGPFSHRWYRVGVSPCEPGISVLWTDVTEVKRAQQLLQLQLAAQEQGERHATARAAELQAVLDTVPAAVWITRDPAATFVEGNRFAAELLHLPEGANMSLTAPAPERPTAFRIVKEGFELAEDDLPVQAAARHGIEVREFALDLVFPDGTVRHLLGNATPILDGARTVGAVGAFLDVTSRKRAEERERAAAARDAFRLRLSDALRPLADPGAISATASRLLASFVGADRVAYAEVRDGEIVAADDFHAEGLASAAGRHRVADYGPVVADAMQAGRTLVVDDVDATPADASCSAMAAAWSIRAWVNVPLRKGGAVAACLIVGARAPRSWSEEEVTLVGEVAERTWAAVERARAEAALREEARRKDEFLAVLSHELRNPLAPIRNSVYVLARSPPRSDQALRAMEVLRRQTDHVTRLVDDLLDVTRISRGKITLRRERIDLRDVVRRTADDLQSIFDESGVELRVELPARPAWVEADRTRVSQVLANLLQNAVKFTPRGRSVAVAADVREGWALLRVRDDGVGMEPSQVERMFEPFAQADQGIARSKGGLGLGLALVKGLVELHGGAVSAHSEGVGRGAEFTVRLPCCAEPRPDREPVVLRHGPPREVLVVEDNPDAAETLADILSLLGHHVRIATDGRSGLALARALRPDLVLCDIGLPDMNGYDLARTIRADEALRGTRLVALTGYAQPEDRQRALDAGFDAHAAKPLEPDVLARLVAG